MNMVLLVKYSLIEESTRRYRYEIFIYPAPCQFLGISCQTTLMQAIQSFEISTRVLFMRRGLTIDSCARSLFARVLNSSVVYV